MQGGVWFCSQAVAGKMFGGQVDVVVKIVIETCCCLFWQGKHQVEGKVVKAGLACPPAGIDSLLAIV